MIGVIDDLEFVLYRFVLRTITYGVTMILRLRHTLCRPSFV
jgi:hypothetical protein